MAAQLEKGLKAVGLVIRTVRDPYPYFRVVSRGREIFLLPQHFLILITYWIYFFFFFCSCVTLQKDIWLHSDTILFEPMSLFSWKRHKRIRQSLLQVVLSSNLSMIPDFVSTWSVSFNMEKKFDLRSGRQFLSIAKIHSWKFKLQILNIYFLLCRRFCVF